MRADTRVRPYSSNLKCNSGDLRVGEVDTGHDRAPQP
jgi:hypothetical protein